MINSTRVIHRGISFELPVEWEWRERVAFAAQSWGLPFHMHLFFFVSGFIVGSFLGALFGLLVSNWTAGALVGGIAIGLWLAIMSIVRDVRSRFNLPGIMKGPKGYTALLFVWCAAEDAIPKLDERLRPGDGEPFVPVGGKVVEQGKIDVDKMPQVWAVRSGPLEVIVDPEWIGRDVPYSADFSVVLPGSPAIVVRLYGALKSEKDDRSEYEAVAKSIRRA